ncbi:SNF2 family N-terminal domain-containing protein [Zopfochytrium polystomum]|nr:SNF2 family N-terminal domain-containing protein [Zopfochytrium polystomum]
MVARIAAHPARRSSEEAPDPAVQPPQLVPGVVLRDYQLQGVQWMSWLWKCGVGGILADEMGLGKTIQSIAFVLHLRHTLKVSPPFLIVVPLSVHQNWIDEASKFAGSALEVFGYRGSKEEREKARTEVLERCKRFDVMVATYEVVINDRDFLEKFDWKLLIVDEAHRLKNPSSVLHTTLASTIGTPHRLLLTGTPVQNNLFELAALLHFAAPAVFAPPTLDGGLAGWFAPEEVADVISPFMLRRNKNEVLTLPPMKETVLLAPLTPLQRKLYRSILLKDASAFDSAKKTSLMNILMQLRKCSNHPYMFDGVEPEPFEAGEHLVTVSGKLLVLDRILKYLYEKGRRVLIFSQMTVMLDILQDYLTYRSYNYERLDGSVRGEERNIAVRSFSGGGGSGSGSKAGDAAAAGPTTTPPFAFLLSTRAGGVGLNLTAADTVIFVDSDFNPTVDAQAAARAHRIGQRRPVAVVRLVAAGSVDEVVVRRARRKAEVGRGVLRGAEDAATVGAAKAAVGGGGEEADVGAGGRGKGKATATAAAAKAAKAEIVEVIRFGLARIVAGPGAGAGEKGKGEEEEERGREGEEEEDVEAAAERIARRWIDGEERSAAASLGGSSGSEKINEEDEVEGSPDSMDVDEVGAGGDMYVYEGHNYRDDAKADEDALAALRATAVAAKAEKAARSSDPRLEQVRAEALERAAARRQELARKKEEKKLARWAEAGYISHAIGDEEDEDSEDDDEAAAAAPSLERSGTSSPAEDDGDDDDPVLAAGRGHSGDDDAAARKLWTLTNGTVTAPELERGEPGIIVQLSSRYYSQAGELGDLAMGSAHLIAVNGDPRRTGGGGGDDDGKAREGEGEGGSAEEGKSLGEARTLYVALLVAQKRSRGKDAPGGVRIPDLETALARVSRVARNLKASVHLPRIGQATPNFDWYRTERIIRKCLPARGVRTVLYYYRRPSRRASGGGPPALGRATTSWWVGGGTRGSLTWSSLSSEAKRASEEEEEEEDEDEAKSTRRRGSGLQAGEAVEVPGGRRDDGGGEEVERVRRLVRAATAPAAGAKGVAARLLLGRMRATRGGREEEEDGDGDEDEDDGDGFGGRWARGGRKDGDASDEGDDDVTAFFRSGGSGSGQATGGRGRERKRARIDDDDDDGGGGGGGSSDSIETAAAVAARRLGVARAVLPDWLAGEVVAVEGMHDDDDDDGGGGDKDEDSAVVKKREVRRRALVYGGEWSEDAAAPGVSLVIVGGGGGGDDALDDDDEDDDNEEGEEDGGRGGSEGRRRRSVRWFCAREARGWAAAAAGVE